MNGPHTYAEWLPLLDKFRAGEDLVIDSLREGTIEWTSVVAERWTRQVADSLTIRLRVLSKQLQTSLDRARGDYFAISTALLLARRGLTPLRAFVSLQALPPDVKDHLASELDRWATETQKSLERHAEGVRHDQGRLLKTIRDHPLNTPVDVPPNPPVVQSSESGSPAVRGRRVIL
jgi:hypothetical protein